MARIARLATLFLLAVTAPLIAEEPMHTKDSLVTVKENVESGKAVLVDVREQREWDAGHVKGAVHLPKSKLESSELAELVKKLDKKKIIYTHCGGGRRALACDELLKKEGFDVRPLKSGYQPLLEAGFENEEK